MKHFSVVSDVSPVPLPVGHAKRPHVPALRRVMQTSVIAHFSSYVYDRQLACLLRYCNLSFGMLKYLCCLLTYIERRIIVEEILKRYKLLYIDYHHNIYVCIDNSEC